MWSIHHDPQHWDRPDLFNPGKPYVWNPLRWCSTFKNYFFMLSLFATFPDRFLDKQGQRVMPSYFLPFGAGPRVCVGESLARLELFLFLSSLLQRIHFSLPDKAPLPNLQGRLGVVLQPLPYKVVVTPRAGWGGGVKWATARLPRKEVKLGLHFCVDSMQ